MIKVFRVTIACERDFTAVLRAIFKCRIISEEPVCVLGTAVAWPDKRIVRHLQHLDRPTENVK